MCRAGFGLPERIPAPDFPGFRPAQPVKFALRQAPRVSDCCTPQRARRVPAPSRPSGGRRPTAACLRWRRGGNGASKGTDGAPKALRFDTGALAAGLSCRPDPCCRSSRPVNGGCLLPSVSVDGRRPSSIRFSGWKKAAELRKLHSPQSLSITAESSSGHNAAADAELRGRALLWAWQTPSPRARFRSEGSGRVAKALLVDRVGSESALFRQFGSCQGRPPPGSILPHPTPNLLPGSGRLSPLLFATCRACSAEFRKLET